MIAMITEDDARRNISANLTRILDDRGWTQVRLAEETGESECVISKVVRGLNTPSVARLARIAEALDVSVDRLLMEPVEKKAAISP